MTADLINILLVQWQSLYRNFGPDVQLPARRWHAEHLAKNANPIIHYLQISSYIKILSIVLLKLQQKLHKNIIRVMSCSLSTMS